MRGYRRGFIKSSFIGKYKTISDKTIITNRIKAEEYLNNVVSSEMRKLFKIEITFQI